jgi:HAD superfamily hydrolase (TIGR01509 family)
MPFQGVILDIDGTLVLSNDAHAQAWVEAFADFGYQVKFEQVRPLIGMGGDQIVPQLAPGLSGKEGKGKQIGNRRKELIINKFAADLVPTKGARELILKLRSEGLRLIIATSATTEELGLLLKAAQVDDLLSQDEATTSSDAEASKPDPGIIEAALSKLGMQPKSVVMLGDTPYDIEAANKAGVGTIAFRCGGFDDEQLKDAIAIYNHPGELAQNYARSPLAQKAVTHK